MADDTPTTVPQRTEAQVMQELAQASVRLTLLELELRRIRNPNGLTFADLEGVLASAGLSTDEVDRARQRSAAKLEPVG